MYDFMSQQKIKTFRCLFLLFSLRVAMEWTEHHDSYLIREILTVEPFNFKPSTVKKGQAWSQIADILNSVENLKFRVNQRAVRERYALLEKAFLRKLREEEKATGISPDDLTDNEKGIEEIVGKSKEAALKFEESVSTKQREEAAKVEGKEIRQKCLETFIETKNRIGNTNTDLDEVPKKKSRSSGSETLVYLREKAAQDAEIKKETLKLKNFEQERVREANARQQEMFSDLVKQQNDQMKTLCQQQNQLAVAQMQSQQQMQQMFLAVIDKLKGND